MKSYIMKMFTVQEKMLYRFAPLNTHRAHSSTLCGFLFSFTCTRLKFWCAADTDVLCSHYIFVSQLGKREGIRQRSRDRPQIQVQLYIQWCKLSIYIWIKISYGVLKAYLIPWKPTIELPFCDSYWAQKHIWQINVKY